MIDMDEIRKEVAIKHDVLLGNDDPLLMNVTINDLLLQRCLSELNFQQEANLKTLLNALQKSNEETKRLAMKVVNEGTEFTCDQLQTAIKATMDEGREELRKDIRLAWTKIESARKAAATWAAVSSLCAAITVGAILANVL